jgi:hypothetical protein
MIQRAAAMEGPGAKRREDEVFFLFFAPNENPHLPIAASRRWGPFLSRERIGTQPIPPLARRGDLLTPPAIARQGA